MGGKDLEQSSLTPPKTTISKPSRTKSGTLKDKIDSDLAFVVEVWPKLPEHFKKTIIEFVQKLSAEEK